MAAQIFAVKLYADDPLGIPDGWPSDVLEVADGDSAPDGYVAMTQAQIEAQKESLADAYESWAIAQKAKQIALSAAVTAHKDYSSFGRLVLTEVQTYLGQKVLSPTEVIGVATLMAPLAGLIGFGFVQAGALLLYNLSANAVLDAPYAPSEIDQPIITPGETLRQHFVSRLMQT